MATSQSSTTSSNSLPGLLAALGGLAALIAFFFLTYWGYSVTASGSPLVSGISSSLSFKAVDFAKGGTDSGLSSSSNVTFILLWLVPVVGVIGLLIGGARGLGQRIGGGAAAPLLLLAGIIGAGALVANALYINSQTSGTNTSVSGISVSASYGFGIGLWLALAGAVLVALGGILSLRANN
jgi:hypothetical protein